MYDFWQVGATYRHKRSGTVHTITYIFQSGGECVADYVSDHGPGSVRLSTRRASDYERIGG